MTKPSAAFAVAAALVALLAGRAARAAAQQFPVQAGVTTAPDSVRVGDPFHITVGVRAPRGATISFPPSTDSASTIQSLDRVAVRTTADTTAVVQYADYRVAAWDVGEQHVLVADAVVRLNGVERSVPIADSVYVRSVLPADSSQRVPKPPRALFTFGAFPWWAVALAAAAVIAALLLWWWRRRRRRGAPVVAEDPFVHADAEFDRVEALGLLDAGERVRYVTLMVEIVRDYFAARYTAAALSLTSGELQHAVGGLPHVPVDRLARVLAEADLIKFARRAVSTERAREIGREARAAVNDEHAAWLSAIAAESAPQREAA